LLRLLVIAFALRCAMSFRDPAYRVLGIVLMLNLVLALFGSVVLNVTTHIYYWGSLGLLLAMQRLEQSAGKESVSVRRQTTKLQPVMPMAGAARRRSS
jgi:hypothetical protein